MHRTLKYILLLIFCFTVSLNAEAQLAKNKFGKNRLQYKVFNWRYYSTNNLDIYFYDDGQQLAKLAANYMEDEYVRITDLLGYQPYTKTKIFLYNSIADLQQSNVGVNENNFTVGGQTNFVKSHVEVAFPGTLEGFKEELVYEVSHMLIMDMMFGGSLTDIFQNTYLMTLPEWFIDGAARYVAYGWSDEMDDYMRDKLRDGKMPKITKVEGAAAGSVGQSVWNYIAERYGRSSISHILNYTRIIRNEETAIANTLGVPFKYFMVEWRSFYHEMAAEALKNYRTPSKDLIVGDRLEGKGIYNSVAFSADGRYMAYTENYRGRYRIRLRNLENGKTKTVFKKGYRILDQETDDTVPVVSWQNNENLGIIGVEKGQYTLYLYNLASGKSSSQVISKISQVNDFNFSPNGKVIVMSAEKEGENDIYLYSLSRNTIRAITNDLYDDVSPTFMPGTNDIIFSSNRKSDTLNANVGDLNDISRNYNLFIFNIDTTQNVLTRVTNTISKDVKPQVDSLGNIYYLSEQKGINNLFRYNMKDSLYKQVTALSTGIHDYAIDFSRQKFAYITLYDGNERVFLEENFDPRMENFTAPTKRQNTIQARYVLKNLQGGRNRPALPNLQNKAPKELIDDDSPELILPLPDSLQDIVVLDSLPAVAPPDTLQQVIEIEEEAEIAEDTRPINTDNYTFDKEVQEERSAADTPRQESFLSTYRKLRRRNTLKGPFTHEPRFMVNSMVTSLVFDPLRSSLGASGIGFVLEGQMNDMLENHKIYGGVMAMGDLRSGDFFLEYEFLKYLLDFNIKMDRRVVIQRFDNNDNQKYILNKVQAGASLPLNVSTRITGGPVLATSRFLAIPATAAVSPVGVDSTDMQTFYAGINLEMVYDNTIVKGFNLYNGTQAKAQFTHYLGIDESEMGFGRFSVEAKNYFPISRDFILATRGYFGSFLGPNNPRFILGGMDNWINHKTEVHASNDPFYPSSNENSRRGLIDNRNILFHEFVTPMRGFNFNAHNGQNVLLFNAELRFPLIKYFYRGPISSNFFRNLQVVGFYDIGSAWTGIPPFMRENSINTVVKLPPENPFRAVIQNYKNPWLSSFGFGVRTVLLGYYAKFDVAYPMEDYQVSDPRFYLTIGYDF